MNPVKVIAIVLLIAGILGLAYGGFSYTKDTTVVKLGPLELSAKEKQTVNVPMWAGVGAIVVGGLLLVLGGKKVADAHVVSNPLSPPRFVHLSVRTEGDQTT